MPLMPYNPATERIAMQAIALSDDPLALLRLHDERRGEIAVDESNREA